MEFWKRKAYSPYVSVKPYKARFVLKGSEEELTQLWHCIENETNSGDLGYFSNFSDDSQTLIVFFGNAFNKREKKRIENKILDITDGMNIRVFYRTEDNPTLQLISGRELTAIYVSESSHESEDGYQTNHESDNQSDNDTQSDDSEGDTDQTSEDSDSHTSQSNDSEESSDEDSEQDIGVETDTSDAESDQSNSRNSGRVIKVIKKTIYYEIPKKIKRKKMMTRSMAQKYGKRPKVCDFRGN